MTKARPRAMYPTAAETARGFREHGELVVILGEQVVEGRHATCRDPPSWLADVHEGLVRSDVGRIRGQFLFRKAVTPRSNAPTCRCRHHNDDPALQRYPMLNDAFDSHASSAFGAYFLTS